VITQIDNNFLHTAHAAITASAEPDKVARMRALQTYSAAPLPIKRDERWHYSATPLLFDDLHLMQRTQGCNVENIPPPVLAGSVQIVLNQLGAHIVAGELPDGVTMSQGYVENSSFIDGLAALNAVVRHSTAQLRVAATADPRCVIELLHQSPSSSSLQHIHFAIDIEPGATLRMTERWLGDAASMADISVDVNVADDAKLAWVREHRQSAGRRLISRRQICVKKSALVRLLELDQSSSWLHDTTQVFLQGSQAEVEIFAALAPRNGAHRDRQFEVFHQADQTRSSLFVHGAIAAGARAVVRGAVEVAAGANDCFAAQTLRALLLGARAEADFRPELVIHADQVMCSHGATVGQLDDAALFYLRSRGIQLTDARNMLISGFLQRVLEQYAEPEISARYTSW
jgi:Fe-S cluster assembly protein SufD